MAKLTTTSVFDLVRVSLPFAIIILHCVNSCLSKRITSSRKYDNLTRLEANNIETALNYSDVLKEQKNYTTKGKPPPPTTNIASKHSLLSSRTPIVNKKTHKSFHLFIQQGRKLRTLLSTSDDITSGSGTEEKLKINTTSSTPSVNIITHPSTIKNGLHSSIKSSVTYPRTSTSPPSIPTNNIHATIELKQTAQVETLATVESVRLNVSFNVKHNTSLFNFSGRNLQELIRKRANNAVWAMGCIGLLMILLFGTLCYSRLWHKRYAGSWIDNLDPKNHLLQEDDVQEVMKSRAKFLPAMFQKLFKKKRDRDNAYTLLSTSERDWEGGNIRMELIEESEVEEDDVYKPLI